MKRTALWLSIAATALLVAAPAHAGRTLRLGTVVPEGSAYYEDLQAMADEVERLSGGELTSKWSWGGARGAGGVRRQAANDVGGEPCPSNPRLAGSGVATLRPASMLSSPKLSSAPPGQAGPDAKKSITSVELVWAMLLKTPCCPMS